jgi:hypothetical protein
MTSRLDTCVTQTVAALQAEPAQCDEVSDSETELAACSVTVSELSVCLDDVMEVFAELGNSLTCENFGNADLTPDVPASCQRLKTACPGLVDFETN